MVYQLILRGLPDQTKEGERSKTVVELGGFRARARTLATQLRVVSMIVHFFLAYQTSQPANAPKGLWRAATCANFR